MVEVSVLYENPARGSVVLSSPIKLLPVLFKVSFGGDMQFVRIKKYTTNKNKNVSTR